MTSTSTIVGITRQSQEATDFVDNNEESVLILDNADNDDTLLLRRETTALPSSGSDSAIENFDYEEPKARNWKAYIWPSAFGITLAGWTGFFGWAHRAIDLRALTSSQFIELVGNWSLPASLVGVAWLLAMRNSRAEANRFADVAASLRKESETLEARLRTVNEEIAMARAFLAENGRELESVGRHSASKLQEAAEQLGAALADSDAKAKTLEQVSNAATTNMEQLRKHLPVVTSAAKDVTNQIGNAGNSAQLQVKTLIAALQKVSEAGQTARGNIDGLEERAGEASVQLSHLIVENSKTLDASIANASKRTEELSQILELASQNNASQLQTNLDIVHAKAADISNVLTSNAHTLSQQLDSSTAQAQEKTQALAAVIENASQSAAQKLTQSATNAVESTANISQVLDQATQNVSKTLEQVTSKIMEQTTDITCVIDNSYKKLSDKLQSASSDIDATTDNNIAKLTQQLEMLRESLEELKTHSQAEDSRIDGMILRISNHINEKTVQLESLDDMSADRAVKLAFAVEALITSTKTLESNLGTNHDNVDALVERSERLLLALDSANREIDESLPAALTRADNRLMSSMAQLDAATQKAAILEEHSDNMLAKLATIENLMSSQKEAAHSLMASSDDHFVARQEQVNALTASLLETREMVADIASKANSELVESLNRVRASTEAAAESSRAILDEGMSAATDTLTEQSRKTLATAIDGQIAAVNAMIEQSFEKNIALTGEATHKLSQQLAEIENMTGNLEARLSTAKDSFGGIDDDSFARQMVLLTESLNSTAIDVAKILSNEVTDTAWASYLKGDRGVFTRRAVKLLDTGEAKAIAHHYGEEPEFREHVNRYIHDFESMMRVLLSTRDGNAIGVTLLSSDVGKLYVALAQAIERLRN
jgi:hypothetical protein